MIFRMSQTRAATKLPFRSDHHVRLTFVEVLLQFGAIAQPRSRAASSGAAPYL